MPSRIFALTGGIASGKSTVAEFFERLGVPMVDADRLARELVAPGEPALERLVSAFGPSILAPSGELDRPRLGQLVFSEADARARLEAILHPRIRERAHARFAELEAEGHPWIGYDVPLLFETGQAELYRPVVVVHAAPEQRALRAELRDGGGRERFEARLAAQWPLEEKLALADHVIDNSGTLDDTWRQVRHLHERLLGS